MAPLFEKSYRYLARAVHASFKTLAHPTQLEQSQAFLAQSQKIAHLGSWVWNLKNDTVWCSTETLNILGLPTEPTTLNAKDFFQHVHPDEQERLQNILQIMKSGKPSFSENYSIVRQDKIERTVHMEALISHSENHYPTEITGTLQDITAFRKLEQQLLQAQKMEVVGQLTSGIAHDFNNLLMVAQGNMELLTEGFAGNYPPNPEITKYATTILAAIDKGAQLTKQLLAFSREQRLQPNLVHLQKAIVNLMKLLRPTLGEPIEITLKIPEDIWPIWVDPNQLEAAIMNLAINARDAMNGKGKLILEGTNLTLQEGMTFEKYQVEPGDYIKISITDTGCGIPSETLSKVFEPFFTTKEVGKGSGLGLSMVYGFVKQSKGHVSIYSEMGHGTSVHIYFPRANSVHIETPEPSLIGPTESLAGAGTILVVEDEPALRELSTEYLRHLGYNILQAGSGPEALSLLQKYPDIDLLFTDVVMPGGITGPELVAKAKELHPNLKYLFTSGYPKGALLEANSMASSAVVLAKPYSIHELGQKIKALLG